MLPELLICSGIVIILGRTVMCVSESQCDVTKYDVHCCNIFPLTFQGALY